MPANGVRSSKLEAAVSGDYLPRFAFQNVKSALLAPLQKISDFLKETIVCAVSPVWKLIHTTADSIWKSANEV
jgi:hypothetical protein